MSLLMRDTRQCAVCGTTQPYTVVIPRRTIESLDFDGRPYETSLLALPYWVQCCGGCKYCASDVRKAVENAAAICKTAAYQTIFNDTSYPYMARQYRAAAHIAVLQHKHADAGWYAVRATWKCEDMQHPLAKICRSETIVHLINAYQQGQRFGSHSSDECMVIADLYRRSGDMHNAAHYNDLAAHGGNNPQVQTLVARQRELISTNIMTRQVRPET